MSVNENIQNKSVSNRICTLSNDEIASNIANIRQNISALLKKFHRENDKITLLGACKTMDKEVTDFIIENNLLDALGDNKVQELLDKYKENDDVKWHFIGNLQTNKVKYIIDKVDLIHSLDRLSLAKEIDKQAKKHNKIMKCLIEVNVGKEESKGGMYAEDVLSFIEDVEIYDNIKLVGLMSVMPNESDKNKLKVYYDEFNEVFSKAKDILGEDFSIKSIGMSNDYETAIEYGSNLIRIGKLIFGDRRYI